MSFDALAWAGRCQPGSAPRKLVLLALADRHNTETNVCFPSIDWLSDWTGLNRKTIINALQDLETAGFIADTKQRKGKTGQVKVYSLTLTKAAFDIVENHYVYRMESDNGEFYIGVRSYVGDIGSDRYTGSGTWPDTMRRAGVVIHKTIVSNHTTRTDAEIAEAMAIKSEINNPLCMNIEYKSTNRSVPKTGQLKSTVFPTKEYQKRYTEPVKEPVPIKSNDLTGKRAKPKFVFACPDGVDAVDWDGLIDNRRTKRAPMTEAAHRGILKKLETWAGKGWPPGPIVANAAERGWTTVFETDEMKGAGKSNHVGVKNDRESWLEKRFGQKAA